MEILRYMLENKICTNGSKQTCQCGRSFKRCVTLRACVGLFPMFNATANSQMNIQYKKELLSADEQHKFCFTIYPIYSLREAPVAVCLLTSFCIFLTLLQLGFANLLTTLDKAIAVCSHTAQHTCSTVVSVGAPELFIIVIVPVQRCYFRLPTTVFHVHRFYA